MNITSNYSPNFEPKKRKSSQIKFIIFHYTGMKREFDAIDRLTNKNSKVSSHYFIKNNGEILNLVPDLYISWHAGVSAWENYKFINKYSIGIEISNPGHDNKYKNYNRKQINSVFKLTKFLVNKYKVQPQFILGHSDISPDRKKDPGEKFPWHELHKKKIGIWHNLNKKNISKIRDKEISKSDKNIFVQNLYKIGYPKSLNKHNSRYIKLLTIAFQRRFRQASINSVIDKECLIISENLIKTLR